MKPQLYTCAAGDTIESVAQRFYGTASQDKVALIAAASALKPGESLQPGQLLTIP